MEFGDIGNLQEIAGDESEGEFERRLIEGLPAFREAREEVGELIDMKLYSVTADKDRGLATTYARTTQRNRTMKHFDKCKALSQKHNKRTLANSFSVLYTTKGFPNYIKLAVAWQQWHASWIYGKAVDVILPNDMATPADIAILDGVDLGAPEDADRSGLMSGSEPPDKDDVSTSEADSTSIDEE